MSPKKVTIAVGELFLAKEPTVINTEVGSGICVCLFSADGLGGGVVHFALAENTDKKTDKKAETSLKYGHFAVPQLISRVAKLLGVLPKQLKAKIVGGAGSETNKHSKENILLAKKILSNHQIPIVGEDIGGPAHREIVFNTGSGRLLSACLKPEEKSKIKVLIVDDSKTIRDLLAKILMEDPKIEIVGQAMDPFEAEAILQKIRPDVITLDVHMPRMTGVQWLKKSLPKFKLPVVMITSLELKDGNEVFEALELGAVDYIQKPSMKELSVVSPIIREKIVNASLAKVSVPETVKKFVPMPKMEYGFDSNTLITIGSSTGGTEALRRVLLALPKDIPPIVIVQHIPPVFSKAFADRMNSLCPFEVKEAESGDQVLSNRVLVAPGGTQMKVVKRGAGLFVEITDDPPMNRHKPSVDYLFNSIAQLKGSQTIGVILTGMGADGAKGLLSLKEKGARTLSQDEASCVVYGMPRVAWEIGASEVQVSLDKMGEKLIKLWSAKKSHEILGASGN